MISIDYQGDQIISEANMVAMQDTQDPIASNSSLAEPPTSPVIHDYHADQITSEADMVAMQYTQDPITTIRPLAEPSTSPVIHDYKGDQTTSEDLTVDNESLNEDDEVAAEEDDMDEQIVLGDEELEEPSLTKHCESRGSRKRRLDSISGESEHEVDSETEWEPSESSYLSGDLSSCDDKTSCLKGRKARWTAAETEVFDKFFSKYLRSKTMPSSLVIQNCQALLRTRTVPQIRTRINNYILGKQKMKQRNK